MTHINQLGLLGEKLAIKHYKHQNYIIIAKNTFNHKGKQLGELDFVAVKGRVIVFVEVKTRASAKFGSPEASITPFKQKKLIRSVQWFLSRNNRYQDFRPQIDVCAILFEPDGGLLNLDKSPKYVKVYANAVELNQ